MPDYIDLDLQPDASAVYQDGIDTITALAPEDWEPSLIEQWILAAVARIAVEIAVLAGNVPTEVFIKFGQTILGIPTLEAAAATGTVTFQLTDDAGHTIDAGTELSIDGVPFSTDALLSVPATSSSGVIGVTARETGTVGNDLAGAVIDVISPSYLFIDAVTLNAPTANGSDGETGDEYADRLADELPTLSTKAIYIDDFEVFARRNPAVGRAMAIDLYDPDTADFDAEGHVTVAVHGLTGAAVDPSVKTAIETDLEANRVLNIAVHVIDGTYTEIAVAFTGVAYDEFDPATVKADAEQALTDALDPTTHGRPDFADTDRWINEPTIYRTDLIGVARNVTGMRHITALTLARVRPATAVAATDVVTIVGHGYSNGDEILFSDLTGGAGITPNVVVYVRDAATDTFKVAATLGGAAIDITTNMTAGKVRHYAAADIVMPGAAPLPLPGVIAGTVT